MGCYQYKDGSQSSSHCLSCTHEILSFILQNLPLTHCASISNTQIHHLCHSITDLIETNIRDVFKIFLIRFVTATGNPIQLSALFQQEKQRLPAMSNVPEAFASNGSPFFSSGLKLLISMHGFRFPGTTLQSSQLTQRPPYHREFELSPYPFCIPAIL